MHGWYVISFQAEDSGGQKNEISTPAAEMWRCYAAAAQRPRRRSSPNGNGAMENGNEGVAAVDRDEGICWKPQRGSCFEKAAQLFIQIGRELE